MTTIISNSELAATINHKGAELISLKRIASDTEYIWEGNPKYWGKHSPILFPIVGTLKNNSFTYKSGTYELTRHGFARDMNFDLISHDNNEVVFSLSSDELTFDKFPFEFELRVIYTLLNSELNIKYQVINKGSDIMPFSIGGHPAFSLPKKFEDYSLQFETEESLTCYQLENDLLSEKTKKIDLLKNNLPLTYPLFENDALIFKELESKQIQILESSIPILNFKFNHFPNFGLWTKSNAPFICLEPWVGYSDVLNATGNILEKEGIQILENNSSKEFNFSIEIL
ncbi:aldose 1-epimerase family protein [Flavobacterium paronense]|uniref:Aldose 1-epimerase family protein n=1 Tax=Flavobacterium paronense TaxID=1392775 RepID=A0ABV5GGS4_9FLAO|nr:aldose 1-epimerase family protein [Flavobacterium paronense]MDN3677139.1 aldose 1-epimerase family protein [Flavobacterium paronense]